jgi:hypothetical protein
MKKISVPEEPLTFEKVWATLQESSAKFDRELQESSAKFDREFQKSSSEFDRRMQESDAIFKQQIQESRAEDEKNKRASEKRWKIIEETMGSWGNNFGSFAEEYFFNSFDEEKQDFFGEHFNDIDKNVKPPGKNNLKDEYDIVMYNDSYVAIVETKFKAHKNDIPKVIKKAETFRILCPDYQNFKIYLGLASLSFYPEIEKECIDNGIAIIKQVGDTVVINDAHLKYY